MSKKLKNPFYHNYLFNKDDVNRMTFSIWKHPQLWFKATYVQIGDGIAFKFKRTSDGRIWVTGYEELKTLNKETTNK